MKRMSRLCVPVVCYLFVASGFSCNADSSQLALELGFVAFQVGSPVAITEIQSVKKFPFESITLKNLGSHAVSSVSLGILLAPMNEKVYQG
jgi:hypothetical protein